MYEASWFFARGGQQQGPTDLQTLRDMLSQGQLTGWDLVWREGMADWLPASQVPELADLLNPASAAPAGPTIPPVSVASQSAPAPAAPYPPHSGYPPQPQPATPTYWSPTTGYSASAGQNYAGEAQTALILACVGLICCLGIILGPIGLALGISARRKMRESGNLDGDGMALAAMIIGGIVTGLNVLGILFYVIAGLASL